MYCRGRPVYFHRETEHIGLFTAQEQICCRFVEYPAAVFPLGKQTSSRKWGGGGMGNVLAPIYYSEAGQNPL